MRSFTFIFGILLILSSGGVAIAGDGTPAEAALRAFFHREAPEDSGQLRARWEEERMLEAILSMDTVRDWAGLELGRIEAVPDCVEGKAALRVPLTLEPGKLLRLENNFMAGHHDGFRNMMCMGIEVEDFRPFRALSFAYKTKVTGRFELWFRIYDRTGGWLDWTIPAPDQANGWTTVLLAVPPHANNLVDMERIGGVMFEVRALDETVAGTICFDAIQRHEACMEGVPANMHAVPDMSYDAPLEPLDIPDAYDEGPVELIYNMSALELPMWDLDHASTLRCLEEERERLSGIAHGALFINPGTRKPIHEDPAYLPKLQSLLVAVAQHCEANEIPFYQMVGVEGLGLYPSSLLFAVEQAAPVWCRGFLFGECSVETNNNIDYLVELMDYLAQKKKKVLYFQQTSYWIGIMQHQSGEPARLLRVLQNPRYKDVFVPMWENLLPASQGLCFGSTMGFWRGGLSSDWGVSAQSWGYANLCLGGTADMPGHWWLRMFLHVVSTGGRYVEIEPMWPFDGENTEGQVRHSKQWAHTTRWIGDTRSQLECDLKPGDELRALRYFDRLLSAGIVRPPSEPARLLSLPKLSLQVIDQNVESETRYQWGIFRRCLEENWWHLGDCPNAWEMAMQTPETDVFATLYDSSVIYDQTVPVTEYGLVSIVPPGSELPESTEVIRCDGARVVDKGEWLSVKASQDHIVRAYAEAAAELPFTAQNCFLSVVHVAPQVYLAYLIDPEERFPVGVETDLCINLEASFRCADVITQRALPVVDGQVHVSIPPAGFRILSLEIQDAS